MDCKKAKKMMSAYIDNMLSEKEKSYFEAHIKECKNCKNELFELKNILNSTSKISFSAPESFTMQVCKKLKEPMKKKFVLPNPRVYGTALAAFALVAAIAFGNPLWSEHQKSIAPIKNDVSDTQNDKSEALQNEIQVQSSEENIEQKIEHKNENNIINKKTVSKNEKNDDPAQLTVTENTQSSETAKSDDAAEKEILPQSHIAALEEAVEINNFEEKNEKTAYSDSSSALYDTAPRASGGKSVNSDKNTVSTYSTNEKSVDTIAIEIVSKLNLKDTEKIVSQILEFDVMGENNLIELSLTSEQYKKLYASLAENSDFEGFIQINNQNFAEISIFTK